VKYGSANSTYRVDLYPYLEQSKLIVPQAVHWFVPARLADTPKYGAVLLLDFNQRENLPIVRRGPRKRS